MQSSNGGPRRQWLIRLVALSALLGAAFGAAWVVYPTDKTPKGAYYRIVTAVNRGQPKAIFPYIETQAQHAAFSIQSYHQRSFELVKRAYPEPTRSQEMDRLRALAQAEDGEGVFAIYAQEHGWVRRLRRDLSGISRTLITGERATVETVRGTRYPFRIRPNGIWGLTLFTARLSADAEKAARDFSVIEQAAQDYQRAAGRNDP